jgi:hypothetical protein
MRPGKVDAGAFVVDPVFTQLVEAGGQFLPAGFNIRFTNGYFGLRKWA